MNERIFELAELALEETHHVMGSACLQEAFDDFYTEKFAELIVKECIQAVDNVGGYNEEFHMNAIKQHFGVEE